MCESVGSLEPVLLNHQRNNSRSNYGLVTYISVLRCALSPVTPTSLCDINNEQNALAILAGVLDLSLDPCEISMWLRQLLRVFAENPVVCIYWQFLVFRITSSCVIAASQQICVAGLVLRVRACRCGQVILLVHTSLFVLTVQSSSAHLTIRSLMKSVGCKLSTGEVLIYGIELSVYVAIMVCAARLGPISRSFDYLLTKCSQMASYVLSHWVK